MKNTNTPLPISLMRESNVDPLLLKIAEENNLQVSGASRLTGGDINEVYLLTSFSSEKFVVKLNDPAKYPGMFTAEKAGLETLGQAQVFTVPRVINTGEVNGRSYLLMEFIDSSPPAGNFWEIFGKQLALLHQNTSPTFGFEEDNYIGSLPQQNKNCGDAREFYISQRLEPQIRMAANNGFELKKTAALYKRCEEMIPLEPPSLVHGDLWSGNYLTDEQGLPCLIDPAVAFAPREMDLGMMKLFGGFDPELFSVYRENYPLQEGWEERIPLWQLYYLLVHLNIFGAGYKSRVESIIAKYS